MAQMPKIPVEVTIRTDALLTDEELLTRFSYHAPTGDQPERYVALRSGALHLARLIVELTPASREQALALTHLDEVVFFANASIARREEEGTNG
jgi:hypothetical protein